MAVGMVLMALGIAAFALSRRARGEEMPDFLRLLAAAAILSGAVAFAAV